MTGIPVPSPSGPPPGADRAGIEAAMGGGVSSQDAPTEIQARIMRIEDLLIARGVASEGDFTGEVGTDDQGQPVEPPAQAQAEGERPAPEGAPAPAPQGAPA